MPETSASTMSLLAEHIQQLTALHKEQSGTMAELIRWCVGELRADPKTHRLRGFESWTERRKIISENLKNREVALLYLEWLATQLENQGSQVT